MSFFSKNGKNLSVIARASIMGFEVVAYMIAGYLIGRFISSKTGYEFWMFWGVFVGLVMSVVSVLLFIKRYLEDLNE